MISETAVEKLQKEAFRGPIRTVSALFLVTVGLTAIGFATYLWIDLSSVASDAFTSTGAPAPEQEATLASRAEWLSLLLYEGLALILAGFAFLLWRWVAAVRLRMTVSALILPYLRSTTKLDLTENEISAFEAPLDPDREAES